MRRNIREMIVCTNLFHHLHVPTPSSHLAAIDAKSQITNKIKTNSSPIDNVLGTLPMSWFATAVDNENIIAIVTLCKFIICLTSGAVADIDDNICDCGPKDMIGIFDWFLQERRTAIRISYGNQCKIHINLHF